MQEAEHAVAWYYFAVYKFDHLILQMCFFFFLNAPVHEGDIVSAFPRYSSPQGYFN